MSHLKFSSLAGGEDTSTLSTTATLHPVLPAPRFRDPDPSASSGALKCFRRVGSEFGALPESPLGGGGSGMWVRGVLAPRVCSFTSVPPDPFLARDSRSRVPLCGLGGDAYRTHSSANEISPFRDLNLGYRCTLVGELLRGLPAYRNLGPVPSRSRMVWFT